MREARGSQAYKEILSKRKKKKKLEEAVLPSAFSQENLVLKPRASLTRI